MSNDSEVIGPDNTPGTSMNSIPCPGTGVVWKTIKPDDTCQTSCKDEILDIKRSKKHPGKEIERWNSAMIRYAAEKGADVNTLITSGQIQHWIDPPVKYWFIQQKENGKSWTTFEQFVDELFKEYEGIDRKKASDNRSQLLQEKAKEHLYFMHLGDISCWNKYIKDFRYWYDQATPEIQQWAMANFYTKIHPAYRACFQNKFEEGEEYANTLGGRIRAVNDAIDEICKKSAEAKHFKKTTKIVCNKEDQDQIWDYSNCSSKNYRRRKKSSHFPKKQKYSKKKKPKDKRHCKCWLCKEEGHYANECPIKKEKVNILHQAGISSHIITNELIHAQQENPTEEGIDDILDHIENLRCGISEESTSEDSSDESTYEF